MKKKALQQACAQLMQANDTLRAQQEALQAQYREVEAKERSGQAELARLAALRTDLEQANARLAEQQEKIGQLELALADGREQLALTHKQLAEKSAECDALTARCAALQEQEQARGADDAQPAALAPEAAQEQRDQARQADERVVRQRTVEDLPATEYGAQSIGRVIMASARLSTAAAASGSEHTKDVLSLALGKTEVLKAEILSIVNSNAPLEEKRRAMDALCGETIEYYQGLAGQLV